jgi:membrane fusion protein (multidrug efflux system)
MSRRLVVIAVVAVIAVGVGAWVLSGSSAPGSGSSPSATLPPVPPSTSVSADARVVPVRAAELAAPGAGGVVAEVWVREGDRVGTGTQLVRLDGDLAASDVAAAEAGLAAAAADAERADAAVRQAAAQVDAATAALEEARAAVTAADAARDATPSGGSQRRAANAEVDRAQAARDAARAQRTAAREARVVAERAAAAARAEVARAEAALTAATAALEDLTLTSPFDGVVASLDAEVGETVAAGTPIVRVADPSAWRFETTDLDETSVGRIAEGDTATISLDAFPDQPIEGRVASIAPYGESTAGDIVYTVVIEPTGPVPDGLRWNMTASATIDTGD